MGTSNIVVKQEKKEPVASEGLVTYQGAVLDVANLLQRVEKGDHDRQTSEKRIQELEKLVGKLLRQYWSKLSDKIGKHFPQKREHAPRQHCDVIKRLLKIANIKAYFNFGHLIKLAHECAASQMSISIVLL